MSSNYGDVIFPKGTIGYESVNGMYNFWYPGKEHQIEIPIKCVARHLFLWKNQGDYLAFAVPMMVFKPEMIAEAKTQYVCIWFKKEIIDGIVSSTNS